MSRISAFYSMDYPAVLAMPLKTFWAYNRNIDRLRAESDQRQLRLIIAAASSEGATSLTERLNSELGSPVVVVKPFDAAGFAKVAKEMSGQKVPVG